MNILGRLVSLGFAIAAAHGIRDSVVVLFERALATIQIASGG